MVWTWAWGPCFGKGRREVSEIETNGMVGRLRYWTVVRQGPCHTDVFTIDPDGRGEALMVFGFEAEAELFAGFEEAGWQVRETTPGEIISVLHGPCAEVERVVLDPLPRSISASMEILPLSITSADFVQCMISASGAATGATPALAYLRT